MNVIIFENNDKKVNFILPSLHKLNDLESVAASSVPEGCKWKIVPIKDVPRDLTFMSAWEWED